MSDKTIEKHYATLAVKYDDFWYAEDNVLFLSNKIIKHLDLKAEDRFVDLGCGTGIYAKKIYELVKFKNEVMCVDFSKEMLSQIPNNAGLKPVHIGAIEFVMKSGTYDKILIKEMIHHIDDKYTLLNGIYNKLNNNGRFLLLLLPPTIDYPLFSKALERYEKLQPHYNVLLEQLKSIGFDTKVLFIESEVEIEREQYFNMVKNRYMSLLSTFDNEEISAGLEEMKSKYQKTQTLKFINRLISLVSTKGS